MRRRDGRREEGRGSGRWVRASWPVVVVAAVVIYGGRGGEQKEYTYAEDQSCF